MKFYSFEEIRKLGSCRRFIEEIIGVKVRSDGRCQAVWRGGQNEASVEVAEDKWFDHSHKVGGGIIELCQIAKFGGVSNSNIQQAQEFLGEWLQLHPKQMTRKSEPEECRYKRLLAEGYSEVARYFYHDENGNVLHMVVKMSHPSKNKEFLQRTSQRWGLGDVVPVLYNRAAWRDSRWVVIVEGEKDADTLKAWGIPSTTNAGGSKKWLEQYNEQFDGKDVLICRDNDDAGKAHSFIVLRNLARHARKMFVICPSALPKGDVTDWRDKEGGTYDRFIEMMKSARIITPDEAEKSEEELLVIEAKEANKKPFSNTTVEKMVEIDGEKKKNVERPMSVLDLVRDTHIRFLGFPRRIGDGQLFDHNRTTHKIDMLDTKNDVIAWIGSKSNQVIHWNSQLKGAVSKEEFYAALVQHAIKYEGFSFVPDYPDRNDIYYTYGKLPPPTENHDYFNRLIDFFELHDDVSRLLTRSMFAAPLTYKYGVPRPCWVIDSADGQGTGKSTLIYLLALLYDCEPIATTKYEIEQNYQEVVKRVVSADGRKSRIFLLDNVTGDFKSATFAQLSTAWSISGKRPYGRGEENRPNNLTYTITSNSASVNNDIASRSFFIYVKRPKVGKNWKGEIMNFINTYRLNIFADIIDILSTHVPYDRAPVTRVPEFEVDIVQPMCGGVEMYDAVCKAIEKTKSEANLDEDEARHIDETIRYRLRDFSIDPDERKAFVRTEVIDYWFKEKKIKTQDIRTHSKCGMLPCVDKTKRVFPDVKQNKWRGSGVMWIGERNVHDVIDIIGLGPDSKPCVLTRLYSSGTTVEPTVVIAPQAEPSQAEMEMP